MTDIENECSSDYTTISLSRGFKKELEQNMPWGMSFEDYLRCELEFNESK